MHLAPDGKELRVRFRVDGVLQETTTIPKRMVTGAISRVKIMSDLDIAERRVPQDGRVGLQVDGKHIDLRVVTLPSVHGESIVIRILDQDGAVVHDLDALGFLKDERDRFERAINQPYGAVLVTGPTGSGKSTTLYTGVGMLNSPEKNIVTIEDPVEFQMEGITQVQINPRAGLTFANGLRAMMRADPDIIMVGEIRDRETAQIAVESALTGHLVLSTLHTNDAPTAITRLTEMGIEPFLVASAIDCVVAQRLARMLCKHCKKETVLSAAVLAGPRLQLAGRHRGLRARRLQPLQRLRIQGPARPLRGHDDDRGDAHADHRAGLRGPHHRGRDARRHAPSAPGRLREGQARKDLDRRGRARQRHRRHRRVIARRPGISPRSAQAQATTHR